ncbi:MAG: hypothetical protein OEV43_05125 [Coriobacteriia bacterium]|nr:hypothetical protein [Coriobacteriia bacterium]
MWQKRGTCIAVNAALMAFLFLSASFNKEYLRPAYTGGAVLATLTGSYSNFMAAYVISLSPACPILTRMFAPTKGTAVVVATAIGVFAILTIEEVTSILGVSEVRDGHDVIASALGASCAILTFLLLRQIMRPKENEAQPPDAMERPQ